LQDGWPSSEVAARFQVSWPTVKRWVDRYRAGESMQDRSSRPRSSPNKTAKTVSKRCVSLRMRLREGPGGWLTHAVCGRLQGDVSRHAVDLPIDAETGQVSLL